MSSPLVSVVIPAYNAALFIEKTLDSVQAQDCRDYELVVVDDGSQDDTQEIVRRYLVHHGLRGRCIRQENRGIAGARNAGMRESCGVYIALLDHDDLWYPSKLRVVMEAFLRHPDRDMICHNENIVREGVVLRASCNGPLVPRMYERLLFEGNALSPSATVFRRNLALSFGGFREDKQFDTAEDYDFWMRFSRVGRLLFLDQVLGEYQLVERRASRRIHYHYSNLENVVRDHFAAYFGSSAGLVARLRVARRLAALYRAAAGELMNYGEFPELQRSYVMRMLRTFPFEPKNIARAVLWFATQRLPKTSAPTHPV